MVKLYILFLCFFSVLLNGQIPMMIPGQLPAGINTTDDEELGRWTIDGKAIIFTHLTSDHEELLKANLDSLGALISIEKMFSNAAYKGGGHAISPDGKKLVFTICGRKDGLGGCDLYSSELQDGAWTAPRNLGKAFNGKDWESQPAFGLDGMSIYFASNRPGGYGGSDIWMVRQISSGIWSSPVNAGSSINTANNEGSPFVHFDGRTIYFMRDGPEGYGGYDLYFSHMGIDEKWKTAINMGKTINTVANEGGLAIHPNGKIALITRSTSNQQNDLFQFILPETFQSAPVQALFIHLTDELTGKPVLASMEIFDVEGKDTIRKSQLADMQGNITMTLDKNTNYGMIATAKGYLMNSSNLPASKAGSLSMDIKMVPVASSLKKTITLQNIFFESGSAKLLSSSGPELNNLLKTLQGNPSMHIEIRGYTDNVGMEESNQQLSEARAKCVFQYLADHGIETSRLAFKGYGESHPVADNESETGRKLNRRTEFFISKI